MTDSAKQRVPGWRMALIRHRSAFSGAMHAVLFVVAFFCAFGIYYNFRRFEAWFQPYFLPLLPAVVLIKVIVFWRMALFRNAWRYVGIRDLISISIAALVSTFFFIVYFFVLANVTRFLETRNFQFPQSIFPLDFGMTIACVCGSRLLVRLYHEELRAGEDTGRRQCLILGAGDTGEALLREVLRMPTTRYSVVGFLDDDLSKRGMQIHGVPVLGSIDEVRAFVERFKIDELLLAIPGSNQKRIRQVVEKCQGMNVRFRTVPSIQSLIEGRVTVSQIRDVSIKDLLGREQVELDEAGIRDYLADQRVLVTGAGGSIGSEICRQVMRFCPARLILLEQAENNLFEIDRELELLAPHVDRKCYVGDICDARRIDRILAVEKPSVIFHAAAHKHVPMMEINVGEAIKNNVQGTKTIADAALRHGVSRFVMISTDKAVNPTSVMGCTKRVAEMYIQQLGTAGGTRPAATQFMTVRFGNVLGSSGSVVPIFARQIAAGGPVTVTDPRMTRYFMTIPEASQLVLQAGVLGKDGDIFLLDMGEPVKIVDLAREMITLSGLRPGEDIEIKFTGIRPGEKLYEELSVLGEDMGKTTHQKIYVWRNRKEDWPRICREMDALIAQADDLTSDVARSRLKDIVPEYEPEATPAPRSTPPAPAGAARPSHAVAPSHVHGLPAAAGEGPVA